MATGKVFQESSHMGRKMSWRKAVRLNNNRLPLENRQGEWRRSSWMRLAVLKHHLILKLLLKTSFPWKLIIKLNNFILHTDILNHKICSFLPRDLNSSLSSYSFLSSIAPAKHCAIGTNGCFGGWAVFPSEHVSSGLWLFRGKFLAALWFLLLYQTSLAHIPWCHYLVQVEFPPPNRTNHKWCLMDQTVLYPQLLNYYLKAFLSIFTASSWMVGSWKLLAVLWEMSVITAG